MKLALAVATCALAFAVAGCNSGKQEPAAPGSPTPGYQGQPAAPMVQAPAPAGGDLSGKVVETMNAGGYTYLCLENNGKKTWVAMPLATIKVGQQISCQPGSEMKNFTSPTLKRTFDSIIFSGGLR